MPVHSQAGGPTLHIVAPAFLRIGTGSGPVHHSVPKTAPEVRGLILLTKIDADLAAVLGPGAALRRL